MTFRKIISNIVLECWDEALFESNESDGPTTMGEIVHVEHGMEKADYLKHMQNPNTWAGQAEVMAARLHYGTFTLYLKDRKDQVRQYQTIDDSVNPDPPALFYDGNNLYSVIDKRKWIDYQNTMKDIQFNALLPT